MLHVIIQAEPSFSKWIFSALQVLNLKPMTPGYFGQIQTPCLQLQQLKIENVSPFYILAKTISAPLTTIEDVFSQVLQAECNFIRPAFDFLVHARIYHLAYKNRVITLLKSIHQAAFNKCRRILKDG